MKQVDITDLNSVGSCTRAGSSPALGTKLRNSQIDSYIELLVRIQHLSQWQIGEIGLRDRLVIYFHFYLFVGVLFLDLKIQNQLQMSKTEVDFEMFLSCNIKVLHFKFRSIAQLVQQRNSYKVEVMSSNLIAPTKLGNSSVGQNATLIMQRS